MFADDTGKIYKQIQCREDAAYLQADLLVQLQLAGDFHFFKVLLAGSEERVFFPRNVK